MRPTYSQLKDKDFKVARHESKMERNKRKIEETLAICEAAIYTEYSKTIKTMQNV